MIGIGKGETRTLNYSSYRPYLHEHWFRGLLLGLHVSQIRLGERFRVFGFNPQTRKYLADLD